MLEGLEVSEISNKSLERTLRLDSEFYSKFNLSQQQLLIELGAQSLTDFTTISDGNHMSISDSFVNEGVPYYRGGDIYNVFIETTSSPLRIPKHVYDMQTMQRSHLQKGDVLMSIVGAIIGNVSLVTTNNLATCSCKLAIIRPNQKEILPEYLGMYLMSKLGQQQIQKFRRGSGQTGLILEDFDQLLIPKASRNFQEEISKVVNYAYESYIMSQRLYDSAEQYLLDSLGLSDYIINTDASNVKSYKNSFLMTGRLDAEYYQPKYDELYKHLNQFETARLGDIVKIQKSIEPGSDYYINEGIPFVRVADLTKFGIERPAIYLDENRFADVKRPQKDTILLSKDGSVGIAYKVNKDSNFITSGAILHLILRSNNILPDYLTLVLNSKVVQMQAERDAGGSIIQHWKPLEISNVIIPILPMVKQVVLSNKVQESFTLRHKSLRVLEMAKQAVEIAFNENEEVAFNYLGDVQSIFEIFRKDQDGQDA